MSRAMLGVRHPGWVTVLYHCQVLSYKRKKRGERSRREGKGEGTGGREGGEEGDQDEEEP